MLFLRVEIHWLNQQFPRDKPSTKPLALRRPHSIAIDDYFRIISEINIDEVLSLFEEKQSTLI